MKERIKQTALAIIGFALLGLWLGYEFGFLKPPKLPAEIREALSIPLKSAGAFIIAAALFFPACALAQWALGKTGFLKAQPEGKRKWPVLVIGAAISIWSGYWIVFGEKEPEGNIEEKREKLEALRRQTKADLFRAKSECKAQAIEFGADSNIVATCLETYRLHVDIAGETLSSTEKRLAELQKTECAAILKSVKKKGGGFVPIICSQSDGSFTYLDEEAE